MEKAYKLAKEGGYEGRVYAPKLGAELLDPLFWQALGKSLGWVSHNVAHDYTPWLGAWHSLINHLAEGGNVDEFFNKLLK